MAIGEVATGCYALVSQKWCKIETYYCRPLIGLSNSCIFNDLEWPSRSFAHCRPFHMQFLYSCAAVNRISTHTERCAVSVRQLSLLFIFIFHIFIFRCFSSLFLIISRSLSIWMLLNAVSDIHCVPLSRKSQYSVVICKKLPQEQDCYFLCHLQAGKQRALLNGSYL